MRKIESQRIRPGGELLVTVFAKFRENTSETAEVPKRFLRVRPRLLAQNIRPQKKVFILLAPGCFLRTSCHFALGEIVAAPDRSKRRSS